MSYDTNIDVKYFNIYKELTHKKEKDAENTNEYSLEDILDICNKLYIDEFSSVFYAENIFDDKIDIGMRNILKLMKENKEFISFLEEIHEKLFGYDKNIDHDNNEQNDEDKQYYVFLSLFNYETFHLIHKIICSHIKTSIIPNDMLIELKKTVVISIEKDI